MRCRSLIIAIAMAAACWMFPATAQIIDLSKYPDLKGQWRRFVVPGIPGQQGHDQTKPWGHGQQAPLTPEYETIFNESLADQARRVGSASYPPPGVCRRGCRT